MSDQPTVRLEFFTANIFLKKNSHEILFYWVFNLTFLILSYFHVDIYYIIAEYKCTIYTNDIKNMSWSQKVRHGVKTRHHDVKIYFATNFTILRCVVPELSISMCFGKKYAITSSSTSSCQKCITSESSSWRQTTCQKVCKSTQWRQKLVMTSKNSSS